MTGIAKKRMENLKIDDLRVDENSAINDYAAVYLLKNVWGKTSNQLTLSECGKFLSRNSTGKSNNLRELELKSSYIGKYEFKDD
jgi:hypothetical protein